MLTMGILICVLFVVGVAIYELSMRNRRWTFLGTSLGYSIALTMILVDLGYGEFWDLEHFFSMWVAILFMLAFSDVVVGLAYKSKLRLIDQLETRIFEMEHSNFKTPSLEKDINCLYGKIDGLEKNIDIDYFLNEKP